MIVLFDPSEHPIRSLTLSFVIWKAVLLAAAVAAPGVGYDTSTLLFDAGEPFHDEFSIVRSRASHHVSKLLRWDALYFTRIARRGRLFEQEWAFGYGYSKILFWFTAGLTKAGLISPTLAEAQAGVVLSIICHFLSVLTLYELSYKVLATKRRSRKLVSFVAASLHIINPAGSFLLAPYTEALFCLFNFTGLYLFLEGSRVDSLPLTQDLKVLLAGTVFGIATTVRSNGLLSGIPFAFEAVWLVIQAFIHGVSPRRAQRLAFVLLGGSLIAVGAVFPQYLAYSEYCIIDGSERGLRPWCNSLIPSIYNWVQAHYWGSGFLRYWTISNLPLFALATPMLFVLIQSSVWALGAMSPSLRITSLTSKQGSSEHSHKAFRTSHGDFVISVSLMQATLALMTFLNAHVQIITRISSGYPLWYWWLAVAICEKSQYSTSRAIKPSAIVKWMVAYGIVQVGLFASFLPPA